MHLACRVGEVCGKASLGVGGRRAGLQAEDRFRLIGAPQRGNISWVVELYSRLSARLRVILLPISWILLLILFLNRAATPVGSFVFGEDRELLKIRQLPTHVSAKPVEDFVVALHETAEGHRMLMVVSKFGRRSFAAYAAAEDGERT